ncbi:MAG: YggT family protein [Acidaminobacteraceae bacterium]
MLLYRTVSYFLSVMNFLIFARVMMSWIVKDYSNPIVQLIYQVTEPILGPIRMVLTKVGVGGTLDFSPIVAMLLIQMLGGFVLGLLV